MGLGPHSVGLQRQEAPASRRLLAVVSIVLAAVVGLAAIYVAASGGRGSEHMSAALVTASTPAPAATPTGGSDDPSAMGDASTISADAEVAGPTDTPTAAVVAAPSLERDPLDPVPAQAALSAPATTRTTGAVEAGSPDDGRSDVTPATRDRETPSRSGWVCDGSVELEDPQVRSWSLGRVSFSEGPGYERVVLHMKRLGPGSGDPANVTAEAFATSRINGAVPGVRRPSDGRTTISLHLADGFKGKLGLRGYRPSGLQNVREFSVYPAGRDSSRVLVSAGAAKCFRLRAPAWSTSNANARTAQIVLDIRS
jgi:hypothetical protein